MKFTKLTIIFIFLLAFAVSVSAQKSNKKKIKISTKDKAEILNLVFDDGFEKLMGDERFLQCTIPIVDDKQIILIETNEPKIFPKQINDYHFKFMNDKEIEAEIKSNNGDCYFQINRLLFENSNKAKVTLWRWIEVVTVVNGKSWYPSRWVGANGLVYEATKEKGKWQIKFLNGTAIVS
jgi:hypothetical protein